MVEISLFIGGIVIGIGVSLLGEATTRAKNKVLNHKLGFDEGFVKGGAVGRRDAAVQLRASVVEKLRVVTDEIESGN